MKNNNPVQASLITTYRCNSKCRMCDIWQHPTDPDEEIKPEYYEKLPSGMRINITGGEPMIREDIQEIFKILYPKSRLMELSTNGFYTDKIIHLAEKYPRTLIRVSIEGLASVNDSLRGVPNGFDRALRTVLGLLKTKCRNIGFSIVISPDNISDLLPVYELCSKLGIELGNSVVHNSWYFHKRDNPISGNDKIWKTEKEFIQTLLKSKRKGLQNKFKDYARAYFNQSILRRLRGDPRGYRPPCGAGKDFFFVDPWGNVIPCNGSAEAWIIGNIKQDSFENIMQSEKSKKIRKKIKDCQRECCFVVTERHEIIRKPWKLIFWVAKNKIKLAFNHCLDI
ncbi:MAG: radical SAM protein [Candidatus Aminicenantes bacterium]|nr:radical SAM protein [Candidatus Aminicenantes bacterium]